MPPKCSKPTGSVSAVAPALAHLLAARAMAGLGDNVVIAEDSNMKSDQSASSTLRTNQSATIKDKNESSIETSGDSSTEKQVTTKQVR